MAESNTSTLLERAKYLVGSHDRLPSHLRPTYSSVVEAFGPVPSSAEAADIQARLDAFKELLDEEIATPLQLAESVEPDKLAEEVKKAATRHVLHSYLHTSGNVVVTLNRRLRGLRSSAGGYEWTISFLRGKLDELTTDLSDAAAALGDKLLAETEHAIEADAAAVGQFRNAAAKLTTATRIGVRDRNRETNDRLAVLFSPVYDAPTPLRVRAEADGEVVLSTPEEVRQHEEAKLLFALWRKGSGLALAAVALGVLPSFEVAVADSWDEVEARYAKLETAASRDVEARAWGVEVHSFSNDDTVSPMPNWEY